MINISITFSVLGENRSVHVKYVRYIYVYVAAVFLIFLIKIFHTEIVGTFTFPSVISQPIYDSSLVMTTKPELNIDSMHVMLSFYIPQIKTTLTNVAYLFRHHHVLFQDPDHVANLSFC